MSKRETSDSIPSSVIATHWSSCADGLNACHDRAVSELRSCWSDLKTLLEEGLRHQATLAPPGMRSGTLREYREARRSVSQPLLQEPSAQWERMRVFRRAADALRLHDEALDALVGSMPETVDATGREVMDALGEGAPKGLRARIVGARIKPHPIALRSVLRSELQELLRRRTPRDAALILSLTIASRYVPSLWSASRTTLDEQLSGKPTAPGGLEERRQRISRSLDEVFSQADLALQSWDQWRAVAVTAMTRRLAAVAAWPGHIVEIRPDAHRAAEVEHWERQMRAVEREVHFELALEQCEDEILQVCDRNSVVLGEEQDVLLAELDAVIEWLQRRNSGEDAEGFPPVKAEVIPAASRFQELEREVRNRLRLVPKSYDVLNKFTASSSSRGRVRSLLPRDILLDVFHTVGGEKILGLFQEIEEAHRKIVQTVERAKEVVAFGLERDGQPDDLNLQIGREAVQNALSMLDYYRHERTDWRSSHEGGATRVLAAVFIEGRAILRRSRVGVFAYFAQQGMRKAIHQGTVAAAQAVRRGIRRMASRPENALNRLLIAIGWKPTPTTGVLDVARRPYLPAEFTVDLSTKELPALYRRLFRLEPIQDPRFLVGREAELEAIQDARAMWETGRPVALIIVGQRGSGKTSLINCALKRCLGDLELVRVEVPQRMVSSGEMRRFLADQLAEKDEAQLEANLKSRRRIFILEEVERTFLRQVGYYEAIRELQQVLAATCTSTFWILVANHAAFQFLNAAVDLGRGFSHRINAGTATREDLRRAILLRHNLSGLRLNFRPPSASRHWSERIRRLLQGPPDPEAMFFDALSRESAGAYRSAIDIWLGQVEEVRSGAISVKPLETPDLAPIIDALAVADLFSLVAILQHGGLTPEEHAIIFQMSPAASRAEIDDLLAREIIEADPRRPGFRVRPEAMRVVREALYRNNLL